MITYREERSGDAQAIHDLTAAAFAGKAYADGNEQELPARLNADGDMILSMVAEEDGEILGHVAASPARVGAAEGWVAIGPLSVLPGRQGKGIGTELLRRALALLATRHRAPGAVLIGDPAFYARLGFVADCGLTWRDMPATYIQRLVLNGPPAAGEITFAPAFDA